MRVRVLLFVLALASGLVQAQSAAGTPGVVSGGGAGSAARGLVYQYQVKRITGGKVDILATGVARTPAEDPSAPAMGSGGQNHLYVPLCRSAAERASCPTNQFDTGHVLTVRPVISPAHQLSVVRFSWRELIAMRTVQMPNGIIELPELRFHEVEQPIMLPSGRAIEVLVYERGVPPAQVRLVLDVTSRLTN